MSSSETQVADMLKSRAEICATQPTKLPWVDWMRFGAAFSVLLVHTRGDAFVEFGYLPAEQQNPFVASLFVLTRLRRESVLLFFVLSGFLVGGRLFDRLLKNDFRVMEYALDRWTRIFIPLLPALVLSGIVAKLTSAPAGFGLFVMNVFGLQGVVVGIFGGNDPLWSLAFEIWFYTLGGCMAWLVQSRNVSVVSGVLLVVSLAVFVKLGVSFLFCWLLGSLAWRTRPEKISWFRLWAGLVLVILGVVGTQLNIDSSSVNLTATRAWLPEQPILRLFLATGFALVMQNLILFAPRKSWLIQMEGLGSKLAASSYTLYLTHFPVLALLGHLGWRRADRIDVGSVCSFLTGLGICLAVTWVFYALFESRTTIVRQWSRCHLARLGWI